MTGALKYNQAHSVMGIQGYLPEIKPKPLKEIKP